MRTYPENMYQVTPEDIERLKKSKAEPWTEWAKEKFNAPNIQKYLTAFIISIFPILEGCRAYITTLCNGPSGLATERLSKSLTDPQNRLDSLCNLKQYVHTYQQTEDKLNSKPYCGSCGCLPFWPRYSTLSPEEQQAIISERHKLELVFASTERDLQREIGPQESASNDERLSLLDSRGY